MLNVYKKWMSILLFPTVETVGYEKNANNVQKLEIVKLNFTK